MHTRDRRLSTLPPHSVPSFHPPAFQCLTSVTTRAAAHVAHFTELHLSSLLTYLIFQSFWQVNASEGRYQSHLWPTSPFNILTLFILFSFFTCVDFIICCWILINLIWFDLIYQCRFLLLFFWSRAEAVTQCATCAAARVVRHWKAGGWKEGTEWGGMVESPRSPNESTKQASHCVVRYK